VIFAEWKPIEEIIEKLKDKPKILIVGCATCVAECAAGGEKEVDTMAPLISMGLKQKGQTASVATSTVEKQCEFEFLEAIADKVAEADVVLSLACGIGVQALAEHFPDAQIYPGVNTSGLNIREAPGVWATRCAACGDCVLGETFGLCPVARCAKSLLNGPCGGTRKNGKCEVKEESDCIWARIVERAEARGALASLSSVRAPKDWSNTRHGGPKKITRDDLRD
jgi:hypothetical protein